MIFPFSEIQIPFLWKADVRLFIVYRMPYETSVLIHFNIADSRAAEYFLGNFVIEAFPFDKDGDDSVFICFIFYIRIFYRNKIKIVFRFFTFLLILMKILSTISLQNNIIKEAACKQQTASGEQSDHVCTLFIR